MFRSRLFAVLAALLVAVPAASLSAQSRISFHVGAGALMPMGDFGDFANTGWIGFAGIGMPLGTSNRLSIGLTAFYGHASHDGDLDEATNIPGALVHLDYTLSTTGTIMPYISVGAGFLQHRYDPGDTGFEEEEEGNAAFGGALGLRMNRWFLDGRYTTADGTDFITISLGLGFGGGA